MTKRRLLSLEPGREIDDRVVSTESISFDGVTNVEIDVFEGEDYDLAKAGFAVLSVLAAVFLFFEASSFSAEMTVLAFLGGTVLLVVGLIMGADALDPDDGKVEVSLRTARGASHSVSVPRSAEGVAVAVSEHAV